MSAFQSSTITSITKQAGAITRNQARRDKEEDEKKEDIDSIEASALRKTKYLNMIYGPPMHIEKNQMYYNGNAALYDEIHANSSWVGPIVLAKQVRKSMDTAAIKDNANTNSNTNTDEKKILDFGAGTGLVGKALKREGFNNLDATDTSQGMLLRAQQLQHQGSPVYKNFHIGILNDDYDLVSDTYDAVVSAGVIGTHVGFDEVEKLMPCVKKGGMIAYTIRASEHEKSSDKHNGDAMAGWIFEKIVESGPLNVDHPHVLHNIVVLRRLE